MAEGPTLIRFHGTWESQRRHLWLLFGIAAVIHGVLDPLVTVVILNHSVGPMEANPLMATVLDGGLVRVVIAQLGFLLVVGGIFWGIIALIDRGSSTEQHRLYRGSVVVLAGLIIWGIGVLGWNVLIAGVSS